MSSSASRRVVTEMVTEGHPLYWAGTDVLDLQVALDLTTA